MLFREVEARRRMAETVAPAVPPSRSRIPRTPDRPLAFIFYVVRHCSRHLKLLAVLGFVFEVLAAGTDTLVAWVLGRIVGVVAAPAGHLWRATARELALLAAVWAARNVSIRLRDAVERRYVPELLCTTRELLFARLLHQNQALLQSNFAGVLANHVRQAGDAISSLRNKLQYNVLSLFIRFFAAGVLLWGVSPAFSLFIPAFVLACAVAGSLTAPRWTALAVNQAEKSSQLTGAIVDTTTHLSLVQQEAGAAEELTRLDRAHAELRSAYLQRQRYGSWFWGTFDVVMTVFFCGYMALVIHGWERGNVTPAQLAMAVSLATNLFGVLYGTISLLSSKFDDLGTLQEALEKISAPLTVLDVPGACELSVTRGSVEIERVDFGYASDRPVFKQLSLRIPGGQRVGLVGVSGAGKSTLCHLLGRAYDPGAGRITIDGQDISQVTQESLHRAIAVIPQEPALFHRTVGENIRYSHISATPTEVEAAARAGAAAEFIAELPQGYDTLVGERGVKLSGGQRQRLAIARAILKQAPILILDEATSALDSETERSIQTAMLHAMEGRTTIVIAHRLSTLAQMDRLVVLDAGQIVEDGTLDQLLAREGIFARLWKLQAGGFLPPTLPRP
jgi:ABC-type multidrug transport system fused ATPase/permease subunit